MMTKAPIMLMGALLLSCAQAPDIDAVLKSPYEIKMISSGRNMPAINLWKDDLRDVLILLHYRVPLDEIQAHFQWSDEERSRRVEVLLENDFIKETHDGVFVPTSMVITLPEGERLYGSAAATASRIAALLESEQQAIRDAYQGMAAFAGDGPDPSFFIMSDVILDNWQINNIERDFIRSERTLRHGMNYYHSVQEQEPGSDREAFGIYGNQMWGRGSYMAGVYGNRRSSTRNLNSLRAEDMAELFGMPEDADRSAFKEELLGQIVAYHTGVSGRLPDGTRRGLEQLGLLRDGTLQLFVLSGAEYDELGELADAYTPGLVEILEGVRDQLRADYASSPYAEEITFEEYAIWWYHFLYTEATNQLAERGVIQIPEEGITTYVVDWGEEDEY